MYELSRVIYNILCRMDILSNKKSAFHKQLLKVREEFSKLQDLIPPGD
jgi:hypothetical protein